MQRETPVFHKGEYPAKTDVPVLLEFFNRPSTFQKVFEQVRIARPATLFLYQDGIRPGKKDEEGHAECRRIAESIDWDCAVYRWYQENNQGCDPSGFLAQRWAFSLVDRCIVLEDDCVPAQSFFRFCEEMLDRYEQDDRIGIICGMNNMGTWPECSDSYFFARRGSIWGWASWSRFVMDWRENYEWLEDAEHIKKLKASWKPCKNWKDVFARYRYCASTKKPYFEVLMAEKMLRDGTLNVIPRVNMIQNVGWRGGTHSDLDLKMLPRFYRKWLGQETHEMLFPLRHPLTVERDIKFDRAIDPGFLQTRAIRIEGIFLQLIHGNGKTLWNKLCIRASRWIKKW